MLWGVLDYVHVHRAICTTCHNPCHNTHITHTHTYSTRTYGNRHVCTPHTHVCVTIPSFPLEFAVCPLPQPFSGPQITPPPSAGTTWGSRDWTFSPPTLQTRPWRRPPRRRGVWGRDLGGRTWSWGPGAGPGPTHPCPRGGLKWSPGWIAGSPTRSSCASLSKPFGRVVSPALDCVCVCVCMRVCVQCVDLCCPIGLQVGWWCVIERISVCTVQ